MDRNPKFARCRSKHSLRRVPARSNALIQPDSVERGAGQRQPGIVGHDRLGPCHSVEVAESVLMEAAFPGVGTHQYRIGGEADKSGQLLSHYSDQLVRPTQSQKLPVGTSDEGPQQRKPRIGDPPLPLLGEE